MDDEFVLIEDEDENEIVNIKIYDSQALKNTFDYPNHHLSPSVLKKTYQKYSDLEYESSDTKSEFNQNSLQIDNSKQNEIKDYDKTDLITKIIEDLYTDNKKDLIIENFKNPDVNDEKILYKTQGVYVGDKIQKRKIDYVMKKSNISQSKSIKLLKKTNWDVNLTLALIDQTK